MWLSDVDMLLDEFVARCCILISFTFTAGDLVRVWFGPVDEQNAEIEKLKQENERLKKDQEIEKLR